MSGGVLGAAQGHPPGTYVRVLLEGVPAVTELRQLVEARLLRFPRFRSRIVVEGGVVLWVEVPEETDKKIKSFIGTLKVAAKAAEDMGREAKSITRDFQKREIYYKGAVICCQDEWTGGITWTEKGELRTKTLENYDASEQEREKKKS